MLLKSVASMGWAKMSVSCGRYLPCTVARNSKLRSACASVTVVLICTAPGCAEARTESGDSSRADTPITAQRGSQEAVRCYRSSSSALLGPIARSRQNGQGPGWIRIAGLPMADSGFGEIVDANRAGVSGIWRRGAGDSVSMTVADDFLRVELRLAVSDSMATGPALAVSDVGLEPDSSGKLGTFRRAWLFRGARASCDSMPLRQTSGLP